MPKQYPESQIQPYFGRPSFVDDQRMQNSDAEFSYVRSSFFLAGQDSFASPPSQDPEMFERLTNIQPVVNGTLKRRWGYGAFTGSVFSLPASRIWEYQRDSDGLRLLMASDTTNGLTALTEKGAVYSVVNASGGGSSLPDASTVRGMTSRDNFYTTTASSGALDLFITPGGFMRYDGTAQSGAGRNVWGIDGPAAPVTPRSALTTVNDSSSPGAGTNLWLNPTNASNYADDYATAIGPGNTAYLKLTNLNNIGLPFDATNPTITITGIQVNLRGVKMTSSASGTFPTLTVYLVKAGTPQTVGAYAYVGGTTSNVINGYTPASGTACVNVALAGNGLLWNNTWSISDITNVGFGVALKGFNLLDSNATISVDAATVTIYTTVSTDLSFAGGNVTLVSGRIYFIAYKNSKTGHISDLSTASVSTGNQTSQQITLGHVAVSPDAQVDRRVILATADGGDETTLYLAGEILDNSTTTFVDNMPEATLLVQPIYLSQDEFGNEFGCASNLRPPLLGTLPTKHRGRIYLAKGQLLYFSKNIAEVTTSSGTIAGRWEECWPGSNFMDISEGAETIQALLSDGSVLYIGSERHIRRLLGDSPDNFQKPEILFNQTGVLSQDVWTVTFLEGAPIGSIWLTPDFRVMSSDFNSYVDIGGDVQDVLNSINQSAAKATCRAAFAANAAFDLLLLAVPTGTNSFCDTVLVYNMRAKKWCVWNNFAAGADPIYSLLYSITSAGVPLILFGSTSTAYQVGPAFTTDRGINITSTVRTSWLDLGDSSSRKILQELETLTGDPNIQVTVDGASLDYDFSFPRNVITNTVPITSPFGPYKNMLATSVSKDRYYRLQWVSTSTTPDVLSGFRLNAVPVHRI